MYVQDKWYRQYRKDGENIKTKDTCDGGKLPHLDGSADIAYVETVLDVCANAVVVASLQLSSRRVLTSLLLWLF